MNKNDHLQIIEQKIEDYVSSLLPHGAGTLTDHRLRHVLNQISQAAFAQGESYALLSLMTIDESLDAVNARLISDNRKPISKRRLQAIARKQHDRFAVGYQVTGTGAWLFRPEEIESLIPGDVGRPKSGGA